MKRILILFLSILACFSANAQSSNWKQKIQAEKIAYLTTAVDFTPEEAQIFWPVYNQYWKEYYAAHKKTAKAFAQLQEDEMDKDYEVLIKAYLDALETEQSIIISYYPKFKAVLPAEKVAKFYVADENFRKQTLRNLCAPHKKKTTD